MFVSRSQAAISGVERCASSIEGFLSVKFKGTFFDVGARSRASFVIMITRRAILARREARRLLRFCENLLKLTGIFARRGETSPSVKRSNRPERRVNPLKNKMMIKDVK